MAAGGDHSFRRVRAFACRVLAHVNFCSRGSGTFKFDRAADAGGGRGIDRRGGGSCSRSGRGLLRRFLLLTTARYEDQSTHRGQAENFHPAFRFHFFSLFLLRIEISKRFYLPAP